MKLKAAILEAMATDQLRQCAEDYEVEVADRRKRDVLIAALRRKRSIGEAELLVYLSEVEVKEVCEALEVPAKGRRAALIERLLTEPNSASESPPDTPDQSLISQVEDSPVADDEVNSSRPGYKTYTIRLSPDPNVQEMSEIIRADLERARASKKPAEPHHLIQDRPNSMNKISADSAEAQSADIVTNNIDQLKSLFPEAFSEDRIDFEVLKQLLGGSVDEREEKYGLNWHGKRRARQLALTPSTGTLRPCPEDSVNWDATQNLMVEGDNLEVLKLLQKSYGGTVKMIYIDPPYNTGKDFVYPDNFQDNIKNYLELTGQVEGGRRISSNTDSSGRFHTDWLNMMYPRLKLAHNLLRSDGFIFVSIDQGEVASLRLILDEIFGEENFVNIFSWVRTRTPAALSQKTKNVVEYVICYERNRTNQPLLGIEKPAQSANTLLNQPNSVSVLAFPAGIDTGIADGILKPGKYGSSSYAVELLDAVQVTGGKFSTSFRLKARFRWSQAYLDEQMDSGTKIRIATEKLLPSYEKDSYGRESLPNLIDENVGVGTNESAGNELERLMGAKVFDYPKPLSLLRYLINSCTSGDDVVLDFFAGSGTTGHAVMQQNADDGARRRFILVQLPEPLSKGSAEAGYCQKIGIEETISGLTRERLKKATLETRLPSGEVVGFKSFKLDTSNIRAWNTQGADLDQALLNSVENILRGRSDQDVLYEALLKLGLPLATPIERLQVGDVTIYAIGRGVLMACMSGRIAASDVESVARAIVDWHKRLAPAGDSTALFLDTSFVDDVSKTNMSESLLQAGFRVRSI